MNTIYTVCTPDHYQHYIPIFIYGFNRIYPDDEIVVGVMGYVDDITKEALKDYDVKYTTQSEAAKGKIIIIQNMYNRYPGEYVNSLRFLGNPSIENDVYVTDVDILPVYKGIIEWCREQARIMNTCYYSPHGCWKYPVRFEGGWRESNERLTGNCVYLTQKWYGITERERYHYLKNVANLYREYDEVMLCRIIKMCKLPIAQSKYSPAEYKGIHFGDFKFEHRWTNKKKMNIRLCDTVVKMYRNLLQTDNKLNRILDVVCQDKEIYKIIEKVNILCEKRV